MDIKHTLGNNIRSIRKLCMMTQERLAEITGLSLSYIQKVESGCISMSVANLLIIAEALGVAYWELLPKEQQKTRIESSVDIILSDMIIQCSIEEKEVLVSAVQGILIGIRKRKAGNQM